MPDPHLESIFNAARERHSPAERAAFLDGACGHDADLRGRVDTLLRAHDDAGRFLAPTIAPTVLEEGAGSSIDRYRLLQQIGEGGFGVVYMAEQVEPIRRKVALKIIKLGMDTRQVIARFESERQALALMDHPNIARVFDGGATATGRPYFVMELVRGIPINAYCDQNNLPAHERIRLFVDVCRAVQHAHQKGVIHRDLKPANVLVTSHDGRPVPKVIDFGIAKATNQRLTEKTLFTEFRQIIGTPQYMSPEQAEMSGLDVDTRSDVYSLGVMLYELLTGSTPISAERLSTAGYVEMQRLIREEDPPEPSQRVSTLKNEATDIAKHRGVEPASLCRLIRGDLDWIVMKSLEKDRTRRYATAGELADDLERHLAHQPVKAGPPTLWYSVWKFARRHRVVAGLSAAIFLALVMGLGLASVGFLKARSEAERAREIAGFLEEILMASDQSGATARVVDVERATDQAQRLFGNDHTTVATALGSLAWQLDHGGEFAKAKPLYQRAIAIWRDRGNRMMLARALGHLGSMQLRQGDAVDALTVLKESVAIARELPPASRLELYDSFVDLAECEKLNGDSRGGIDHLREALELLSGTSTPQKFRKAELLGKLANALILAGRDAEAEPMFLEMIDAWRALLPADHPTVGYHQVAYSLWLRQRGRNAEAEPYLREAIRIYRATPHPSREYHLLALDGLFQILVKREESIDESIELFRQCMTEMGSLYGPDSLMLAQQFVGFSRLLEQRRKWAEMIPFVIEAIRIQRQRDTGDAVAKSVESQLDLLARATRRVVITPNLPPESYGLAQQGAEVLLQEPEYEKTARELLAMVRYRQGEFALALAALPERTPPAANADMEVAGRFIEYASFRALAQFRTGDRPAAVATLDSLTVVRDQWKTSIPTDASEILKEAQRTVTEVESPSH